MPLNSTLGLDQIWLSTMRSMGRRPKTIETYEYATGQLKAWRDDDDLATLTRFEALSFVKYLNEAYRPGGVASRIKTLRSFYSWCLREELVTENPFRNVTIAVPEDPRPTASDDQVEAMLTSAKRSKRDYALLSLLVDSGCRKGEIAAVTVDDIDLNSGMVTFRESKSRPRTVPLSDRAEMAIVRWLRVRGLDSGSLWAVGDPYSLVKACVRRHSGGTLTPHALRRRFAVEWLSKGGSEVSLMRLCGWSSREMVLCYTRASADVLAHDEFRRLLG